MILSKVRKTIEKHAMIRPGDRVGVAVSGGADSVALLALLRDLAATKDYSLVVIHVNHGLRGGESDRDQAFVEDLGRTFSLPVEVGTIPPGSLAEREGGASLENRARTERYRLFEAIRTVQRLSKIALGHTLDDQAETVLMKFLRGTGLAGLRGILPVRDGFYIRPLLETTREEVLACLRDRGLACVTDSSNADEGYLRNRIRRTVLPELTASCNPSLRDTLGRMAAIFQDEEDYLRETVDEYLDFLGTDAGEPPFNLSIARLFSCHRALQRRLIRQVIEKAGVFSREGRFDHVEAILALAGGENPSGSLDLGRGLTVRREYGRLIFENVDFPHTAGGDAARHCLPEEDVTFSIHAECPGRTKISAISRVLSLRMVEREKVNYSGLSAAFMDADAIEGPLTVRTTLPGDRIQPLGMEGHKKLKSIFIDEKVPRRDRRRIPLLADNRSVVWVPGICMSERVRVREGSRRILKAEII